ncbi:MAG TPA: DUF459 domain-containing protein [Acidimicrobiia bacterium]|nr:DUF459 domain-containing protein [Acidimicrobiia bacterium]
MIQQLAPPEISEERRFIPAGIVLFVVVTSLLLGLLLNAPDILRTAQRQEPGWQRTVGVGLMEPIADVSHLLFLDRPRMLIDTLLDRAPAASEVTATPTTLPPAITPTTSAAPATSTSTTSPEPTRRTVTETDPLVMYIGGDSLVGQFGPMLDNRAAESGLVESEVVYEFESGLSRPDFIDWPDRLANVSEELDPDVFVLYFGGNDAQAIYMPDGSWIEYDTPEWEAEYRRRVDAVMTQLENAGHWVYWMGMPIVSSETFRPRVQFLNEIYQTEAADHPQVTFVEAWSVFEGPDGGYSEYLTDSSGDLVDMRLDDGVHYTTAGAIRLAEVTYDVIAADWNLP